MSKKALQVRLDEELYEQLRFLAERADTSMNQLVAESLRDHLPEVAGRLQSDLAETVRRLREYAQDPANLERDLDAFVEAEATIPDPVEGVRAPPEGAVAVESKTEAQRELADIVAKLG